jgi:hypothetical protein
MTRHILGVSPARPGFSSADVTPNIGDLQWAEGLVPTQKGDINVRLERTERGFDAWISAAEEIHLRLAAPLHYARRGKIRRVNDTRHVRFDYTGQ